MTNSIPLVPTNNNRYGSMVAVPNNYDNLSSNYKNNTETLTFVVIGGASWKVSIFVSSNAIWELNLSRNRSSKLGSTQSINQSIH